MRNLFYMIFILAIISTGCAPVVVGGAATGAYKTGTDERTMGTMVDDSTISSKVKMNLISASDVKARRIDVDVLNGVVTLTGLVESAAEIKKAEEIAFAVAGVKGVTNYLTVGSRTMGQALEDNIIVGKINSNLIVEPNMRSLNIDVDSNNGVVTLTGIVANAEQKNRALEIAKATAGVVKVVDNLKVNKQ
ncbi:BON domain-containing protein [Thermodesulfobacteriota bacterium]